MEQFRRSESLILASPLVIFLLLFLGFPAVVNLVYSISDVRFETLRSPTISGLGNYFSVLTDPGFWRSTWFSLRFGLMTAVAGTKAEEEAEEKQRVGSMGRSA